MKNVFATALIAATAFFALPASAQVGAGSAAAIAHFNKSAESTSDVVRTRNAGSAVTVSTRSGNLAGVYAQFNESAENTNDLIGQQGATVVSGRNSRAADIFARIRSEQGAQAN